MVFEILLIVFLGGKDEEPDKEWLGGVMGNALDIILVLLVLTVVAAVLIVFRRK